MTLAAGTACEKTIHAMIDNTAGSCCYGNHKLPALGLYGGWESGNEGTNLLAGFDLVVCSEFTAGVA